MREPEFGALILFRWPRVSTNNFGIGSEIPDRGFVLQLPMAANAGERPSLAVSSKQAMMAFYRFLFEYY
jgi:hypothetical protein